MTKRDRFAIEYGGKPLRPEQASERLPFTARQIREMCQAREIEHVLINGRYYLYPAQIDAWIRTHTITAA